MSSQTKVYISNLNYNTTEDELREHLAGTNASNVFIPNYFLGFGSSRFKPLGIAYADFPTSQEAEEFIKTFDGLLFKDRKLKAKLHVPYVPNQKVSRRSSVNSIRRLTSRNGHDEVKEEKKEKEKENKPAVSRRKSVEKKYSTESVFLKGVRSKTTEEDIRELLKEFNPKEIRPVKPRGWMQGLRNRHHSVIVTLDIPQEQAMVEILRICQGNPLFGTTIKVSKAYQGADTDDTALASGLNDNELPDASQNPPNQTNDATKPSGPGQESCEPTIASSVEPVINDNSRESTMKSFEQENASGKAIHELNIHSENKIAL